jgi:hypothetical protein
MATASGIFGALIFVTITTAVVISAVTPHDPPKPVDPAVAAAEDAAAKSAKEAQAAQEADSQERSTRIGRCMGPNATYLATSEYRALLARCDGSEAGDAALARAQQTIFDARMAAAAVVQQSPGESESATTVPASDPQ